MSKRKSSPKELHRWRIFRIKSTPAVEVGGRGLRGRRSLMLMITRLLLPRAPVIPISKTQQAACFLLQTMCIRSAETWDEFAATFMSTVSSRVRDIIEEFAPGIHYFIPVDVDDGQGGCFRVYFFVCGVGWMGDVVALEASGITESMKSFAGDTIPAFPDFIGSERFAYLDASKIDGAPLLYGGRLSLVFCRELVARLGDILPSGKAFVPMGVA